MSLTAANLVARVSVSGAGPAAAELNTVGGAVTKAQAGFGRLGSAGTVLGGRLGHAKHAIGELVSGPLGFLGLSAGIFGVVGIMEKSVDKTREFGAEVLKLARVSGLSTETTSNLAAALDHFGIGSDKALRLVGFLEKNVGNLAARKDGIKKFQDTFGIALTDSSGHLKDANALILESADFFNNKHIPATQKAAALSKLFGRSWQDLVPFLAAGRSGIAGAEEEARRLGLTLTGDNLRALKESKEATRSWGDALGGLELQIGLTLLPAITDATRGLTSFVGTNRNQIVGFFREGMTFAKGLGDTIRSDVIPVFSGIAGAWNAVPGPLKDLLIKGLVAGKVSKFLFDFGPIDFIKSAGGLLGKVLERGGSPANPMWVAEAGGGLGGGAGLPGAAGKGGSVLGKVAKGLFAVAAIGAAWEGFLAVLGPNVGNVGLGGGKTGVTGGPTGVKTPAQVGADAARALRSGPVSNAPLGEHALDRIVVNTNKANALLGAGLTRGHRDTDKLTTIAAVNRRANALLAAGLTQGHRDTDKLNTIATTGRTSAQRLNDLRHGGQTQIGELRRIAAKKTSVAVHVSSTTNLAVDGRHLASASTSYNAFSRSLGDTDKQGGR